MLICQKGFARRSKHIRWKACSAAKRGKLPRRSRLHAVVAAGVMTPRSTIFDIGQGHRADLVNLNLPMSIDKALESYSDWLVAQVDNVGWRESYRAAGAAAIKEGYEL